PFHSRYENRPLCHRPNLRPRPSPLAGSPESRINASLAPWMPRCQIESRRYPGTPRTVPTGLLSTTGQLSHSDRSRPSGRLTRVGIDAIRPEKPAVLMLIAAVLSVSACAGPDRAPDVAPISVPVPDVRSVPPAAHPEGSPTDCRRWLAEDGEDDAVGSEEEPWATLQHALESIPETGCNVEVLPGTYAGARIDRHYTGTAVIRSAQPYLAVLEGDTTVLDVQGAFNVAIEGFEVRQVGPESTGVIVNIEEANGVEATWIEVRDNIIHDSFDDDLLKIRDAARHVSISGNVF